MGYKKYHPTLWLHERHIQYINQHKLNLSEIIRKHIDTLMYGKVRSEWLINLILKLNFYIKVNGGKFFLYVENDDNQEIKIAELNFGFDFIVIKEGKKNMLYAINDETKLFEPICEVEVIQG